MMIVAGLEAAFPSWVWELILYPGVYAGAVFYGIHNDATGFMVTMVGVNSAVYGSLIFGAVSLMSSVKRSGGAGNG